MSIIWKTFSHKRAVIIIGITFFIVGALIGVFVFSNKGLSQEFISTRNDAASVSQEIVNLTDQTDKALEDVNKLDIQGKKEQALGLIEDARKTNNDAYQKAFQLSGHLKSLTESLQSISNGESQRIAYEAIATELALVSEFIVYTKNVNQFLDELSSAISQNTSVNRQAAQSALDEANAEAKKINALNAQFLQKMGEFDASIR